MSTMMCTYYLGGKILVKALSNQRGLGKELVELVRRLYLQHLLGLVLLQDHNGAINLDLELLQDAQALLFGFFRLSHNIFHLLVLDQVGGGAGLIDGALEGYVSPVDLWLVGFVPTVLEGHLDDRLGCALLDELCHLGVPLHILGIAEKTQCDRLEIQSKLSRSSRQL